MSTPLGSCTGRGRSVSTSTTQASSSRTPIFAAMAVGVLQDQLRHAAADRPEPNYPYSYPLFFHKTPATSHSGNGASAALINSPLSKTINPGRSSENPPDYARFNARHGSGPVRPSPCLHELSSVLSADLRPSNMCGPLSCHESGGMGASRLRSMASSTCRCQPADRGLWWRDVSVRAVEGAAVQVGRGFSDMRVQWPLMDGCR